MSARRRVDGAKQVTMEDVAREAGVSRALVSLVFRDVPGVSAARRALVLAAAERLDYAPNRLASRLASTRTNTVGLLVHDLHNPVFAQMVDGILEVMDPSPLQLIMATAAGSPQREREAMQRFIELRTDAVMAIGTLMPPEELRRVARRTQLLLLSRVVETVDSITDDTREGARLVTEHLLDLGHRRIAHIAAPRSAGYDGRLTGYETAMRAAGLEPSVVEAPLTQAGGGEAVAALLAARRPPTAVFAYNDVMAIGALDTATAAGVAVPSGLSVAGYDNTTAAALRRIDLTSVDSHSVEMGREGARITLGRLATPDAPTVQRVVAPSVVVRGSTERLD